MANGSIIVTGGNTDYSTSLFNPTTMTWSAGPYMNIPRGYQVLCTPSTHHTMPYMRERPF